MAKRTTRKKVAERKPETALMRYCKQTTSLIAIERASSQVYNGPIRHTFSMSGLTLGTLHFKPVGTRTGRIPARR